MNVLMRITLRDGTVRNLRPTMPEKSQLKDLLRVVRAEGVEIGPMNVCVNGTALYPPDGLDQMLSAGDRVMIDVAPTWLID